jgi:hypothetical protein
MKYIILKNNALFRLASTEEKKNLWLLREPGSIAKQVSDSDFRTIAIGGKDLVINGDTVTLETIDTSALATPTTITDPVEIKNKIDAHIEHLKKSIQSICQGPLIYSESEKNDFLNFLDSIDISSITSIADNENLNSLIYNLPNCPQVFLADLV